MMDRTTFTVIVAALLSGIANLLRASHPQPGLVPILLLGRRTSPPTAGMASEAGE